MTLLQPSCQTYIDHSVIILEGEMFIAAPQAKVVFFSSCFEVFRKVDLELKISFCEINTLKKENTVEY